jgi:hypothetical protein
MSAHSFNRQDLIDSLTDGPAIPISVTITIGGREVAVADVRDFDSDAVDVTDPEELREAFKSLLEHELDNAIDDWLKARLDFEARETRANPHMPRHPRPVGPRGGTSEPQSILLPEDEFTPAQARAWVKRHGYKVSGYEAPSDRHGGRGAYHRFRQFDPDRRHSYRTIPFGDSGIMAVVEVPKRK